MDNPGGRAIVRIMDNGILIAGGGLNGCALAVALSRAGFKVTVIDAQPRETRSERGFDGRSYALAHASRRLLDRIGAWDAVADEAQPMLEIKVTDGRPGEGPSPFLLHFDHAEIEEGPMGWMVEDRHLRPALLDAMEAEGVRHLAGETLVAQEVAATGVTATLGSGTTLDGVLLVGCDGRSSGVARRAGIGRTGWGYGQKAVVCAVAHEREHGGIAHQFFMPGGPLAILPLKGNRSSIVWSERETRADALLAMDDAAFLDALRPAFGSFLGEISLEGARFGYPLGLSLAERFVAPRVALLGDAAHGVHPVAGQGLNAGLRDVGALVAVLSEARQRGEEIGASPVLARYERWRRFDTATLAAATDGVTRLFSNDNPLLRGLRDLGLGAVNALPGLRRGFIREAAGLTGELPPLMRP
ncbi:UbiH/UbiF/VisC/COQ6 family ubiquinone biosynthesis hydroxylase [Histidinibacterium aquaticum]|uniref:UbiH/UbiF/VisC/COQ6 family ubiquinone biosynthesis hydroxylase n=1 Tax=Histidinibacterium aquaticum TaxID=2613962 RepID=A0A5J5GEV1_9RHOB|nr:UbiH/UbiF/VisC/COQ6 family ubiquinone biosynthesis hydroxylase [Histidinibacterium aquaticum]KAA9006004.1 UbiH/UbiF/VisC/COQ6 family ubiquinone biosynthesis hydroxylase [Histidinibacterium aquaticum]